MLVEGWVREGLLAGVRPSLKFFFEILKKKKKFQKKIQKGFQSNSKL